MKSRLKVEDPRHKMSGQLNNETLVFMGTTVSSGRGKILVTKTGRKTEIGKIAIKLKTLEEEKTPLQKRVAFLAQGLAVLVGGICLLIFLTGVLLGKSTLEMFTTSVAIAVAAIPEGMVVSLTVILAIGMQRILKRKALVRKLLAAETLGSVTVIATDKTGTLTEGTLKVVRTDFTNKNLALKASILVNNQADPLEVALWEWAKEKSKNLLRKAPSEPKNQKSKIGDPQKIAEENPRVFEMPFDPEKKYQVVVCRMRTAEVGHENFCGPLLARDETQGVHDVSGAVSKATSTFLPKAKTSGSEGDASNFMAFPPSLGLFISGAPEIVLSRCQLSDQEKKKWMEKIEKWGKEGLRTIGLGHKMLNAKYTNGQLNIDDLGLMIDELTFLGLVGFEDPVRERVAEALKVCEEAGIKVKIVTGDYSKTAVAVWRKLMPQGAGRISHEESKARIPHFRGDVRPEQSGCELVGSSASLFENPLKRHQILRGRSSGFSEHSEMGIARLDQKNFVVFPRFLNGSEIEKMPFEELRKMVDKVEIFARVTPSQKLKIVEALKANGEVVALVGDGVNDAPALKRADIGIVVGEASDVAKETADMVLLDSNFKTIVAAVEEGRGIFENIKKVILYLLSDSFSEVFLVLGSLLFGLPLPLTAAQILYINLLTDGFPDLALTVEPKEKGLLKRKPIKKEASFLDLEGKLLIGLVSSVTALVCLFLFTYFFKRVGLAQARTITFVALGADSLFYVFSVKSLKKPILKTNLFLNPYLLVAVGLGFILQILPLYHPFLQKFLPASPLSFHQWLLVLMTSLFVIILIEGVKFLFLKKKWVDR